MEGSFLHVVSPLVLSIATLLIALLCNLVRHLNASKWPVINKESVLRLLGIRLGDIPTTVILDSAVAVDALVRRADAFSDRPAGGGATTIISNGRLQIITTVPYGPHWVALRRNLTSEAFHPVRGLARAAPHRARALAVLVDDIATRSAGGGGVPVRECLYAALFALNAATCFGNGVDGELVEAMRAAQQEFLRILPSFRVFATFQKVARLLYCDRWKQLVHSRRRQEELYLPLLIRACQERQCTGGTTAASYVDTLLDLEVPDEGNPHGRRKLSDGEMVGLVSEYLGASTGTILAVLEWTLANLVLRPDIQSRLRGEIEAAAGGDPCAYLRAVVMESLRRHPPVPSVQRHMSRDVVVGSTPVARGTLVNFSLEEIGRDGKATARGGLSTKAAERALRVSERRRKKVCMKTRYLVSASNSDGTADSTTEESSGGTYVNPVQQLKGKEKKLDFWELQKELGTSQENVMLLEVQLNREKNRYTRLKAARKAAADKAKKKTKCIPESDG